MPDDPTSPTPDPTLFAEDSLASLSHRQEDSLLKTTPAISGRKCLELSGNSGPLGLLEKTLLGSSNWAWTKYSLTWKAKATPQGRLIFQLARQAPRTSDSASGLLHTPTAKANQMAPSMATRDSGSWGLGLWPTPTTTEAKSDTHNVQNRIDKNKQVMLCHAVRLYPTPSAQEPGWKNIEVVDKNGNPPTHPNQRFYDKETGRIVQKGLQQVVKMYPTPVTPTGGGERSGDRAGTGTLNYMARSGQLTDQKSGGSLNPMWVAWLMGYPTEYLNSVPWETASSRKSRKKSDKQ